MFANGIDYSAQMDQYENFGIIEPGIVMSRHNDTLVVVFGNSGKYWQSFSFIIILL